MRNRKTIIILSLLFFGILICFSSCASGAAARENRLYSYISESSKYFLLPPECIEKSVDMAQHISASYGYRNYSLNAWVKADKTGIDMTLLNEIGTNIGELSYRDGTVSFSSPVFPKSLKSEYIVTDFQLCFYNIPALRKALSDCGLKLEYTETGRRIYQKKAIIIEIEKNAGSIKLVNHLRGYTYTLEGDFK